MRTFLDGVFLSRPVLWIPVWGFCVFGYARAMAAAGTPVRVPGWGALGWQGWFAVVLFSCAVGCVYVVNQLADQEADRRNPGFTLLAHGRVSRRIAWVSALVLALAPLAGAALMRRWWLMALAGAALVLGAIYSLRPARLSGRPIADFLSNALGYGGIAFSVGWRLGGGPWSAALALAAAPYFLLMCAGSISSTIPDIEGDRHDGKRTTAVAVGPLRAHMVATGFVAAGGVAGALAKDWLAVLCAAAALPIYLVHLAVRRTATMEACYKAGGAAAMLAAAAVEPVLALAGLSVFLATRWYFRARFGVAYPSLVPVRHAS